MIATKLHTSSDMFTPHSRHHNHNLTKYSAGSGCIVTIYYSHILDVFTLRSRHHNYPMLSQPAVD